MQILLSGRFSQLFLENVIRHGKNISNIRIFCSEFEGTLIITCEDDGAGIQTEEKEKIFVHGYGNHTGIGLFIAHEILSITKIGIRETGVPGKRARFEIIVSGGDFRWGKKDTLSSQI